MHDTCLHVFQLTGHGGDLNVRPGRGDARDDAHPPPEGQRWLVEWNDEGQPVGDTAVYLNRRFAATAKKGTIWPIDKK